MSYQHLTLCDRKVIKKLKEQGKSIREIAEYIGYHPSTVSRELMRNKEKHWYHPKHAHEKYISRRRNSKTRILDANEKLRNHVVQKIENKESPDVIAGRLKLTHSNQKTMQISHEAIYTWIYSQAQQGSTLYQHLARGVRKRNKRLNNNKPRIQIPGRVSIHARPESIDNRTQKGHWEGDTITGKRHQGYIATLAERKSYFLAAGLMNDKRPETCNRAILEAFGDIQNQLIKSITFDNGTEFYRHQDLQDALECSVYFADPYSAWQRGINEHTNGLLRRYFPKTISFKCLTQNDVDEVVNKLNNTPRRSLGYRTPYEVFHNLSVALET